MIAVSKPTSKPTPEQRRRDRWIPLSFFGMFACILVANGALVYYALNTWTGLGTDDAYVKGLAYNETLAASEAQAKQGWQAELDYRANAPLAGRLTLDLKDRHGTAIENAEVTALIVRPTHEGHDFPAALGQNGEGRYAADLNFPLAGLWEIRLEVVHERGTHSLAKRLMVRQ